MPYKNTVDQKICSRKAYENNKDGYKQRAMKHKKIAIQRNRIYVFDYLSRHHCASCGESDPMVLQFDHKEDYRKVIDISNAVQNAWSISRLKGEIEKCQVLCANCHARKSAIQLGWYRSKMVEPFNKDDLFCRSHEQKEVA